MLYRSRHYTNPFQLTSQHIKTSHYLPTKVLPGCSPKIFYYSIIFLTIDSCQTMIMTPCSVRIAGEVGGVDPSYLILPTPLPLVKIRPRGGRVSTPPPKFC